MEVQLVGDWGDDAAYTWLGFAYRVMERVRAHLFAHHPQLSADWVDWIESSVIVSLGKVAEAWRWGQRHPLAWKRPFPQCTYQIHFHILVDGGQ